MKSLDFFRILSFIYLLSVDKLFPVGSFIHRTLRTLDLAVLRLFVILRCVHNSKSF